MSKREPEIMQILESYDLTKSYWSAAELAGCATPRRSSAMFVYPHLTGAELLVAMGFEGNEIGGYSQGMR